MLLYDSVPGGTGYLHQLLSQDAQTLGEVLTLAHAAIQSCTCQADPEKEGCYRCVYQYRQGRAMAQVSRKTALEILGGLVGALDKLERIKSISEIFINPQFDSVLESRFVESLRRLGGAQGDAATRRLPTVRVLQEVVKGKSGYLLEVAGERYWIRPQVDLGAEQGVVAACRPDFLIEPVRSTATRCPIAVFADGWAYHRHSLRDDARKRSALVASGKYWVWSVTWDDVEAALVASTATNLDLAEAHLGLGAEEPPVAQVASRLGVPATWCEENAVAGLLRWLAMPMGINADDQGLTHRQREAAVIAFRMVGRPGGAEQTRATKALEAVASSLPDGCSDAVMSAPAISRNADGAVVACYAWPRGFADGTFESGFGAVRLSTLRAQPER